MGTALLTVQTPTPDSYIFEGDISLRVWDTDTDRMLFAASDVCDAAGLANVSDVLSRLDEDEKGIVSIDTRGGRQNCMVVTEPGFYSLLGSFRLRPEHPNHDKLKRFRRWVNHEVLPSIRKTGSYSMGRGTIASGAIPSDPFAALAAQHAATLARLDALEARQSADRDLIARLVPLAAQLRVPTGEGGIVGGYGRRQLTSPYAVKEADGLAVFRDRIKSYVADRCEAATGNRVPIAALFADFAAWYPDGGSVGESPGESYGHRFGVRKFSTVLAELGFQTQKANSVTYKVGMRLRAGELVGA